MFRSSWTAALVLLLATTVHAGEVRDFGEALTDGLEPTPIAEIVADPDVWVGKQVRIEGRVSGVCARQGCWIDLVSPEETTLRVKVDDGVIVFPQDAVGRQAAAEGTVEILELERQQYEGWLRHQAEEAGETYEPTDLGDGPYRIVRLRGLGARIAGP